MFYDKYKELCVQKGISPSTAALNMGFNKSTVTSWKAGTEPRAATLKKVAAYFNVPMDYFFDSGISAAEAVSVEEAQVMKLINQLSSALDKSEISPDEQRLLSIYRSAPEQGKAFLLNAADMVESAYLGKNNQPESVEAAS